MTLWSRTLCACALMMFLLSVACTGDDEPQVAVSPAPEVTTGYRIDDISIDVAGERWVLEFTPTWLGPGEPVRKGCTYQIYDPANELLVTDTFTLFLGSEPEGPIDLNVAPPEGGGTPQAAQIRCLQ